MTRWLEAAKRTPTPWDKTDKTDRTPDAGADTEVLSVMSVLSEASDPDPDGVARTPEAIERVWSEAVERAREYRRTMTPPNCALCGKTDWTVSLTEPDGRKLHVACWKEEAAERKNAW